MKNSEKSFKDPPYAQKKAFWPENGGNLKPVRHRVVEDVHVASLGPFCDRISKVEVVLTIFQLNVTSRQTGRQAQVSTGMHAHTKIPHGLVTGFHNFIWAPKCAGNFHNLNWS